MDVLIKEGQWWLVPVLTGLFALGGSWLGSKLGKSTEQAQWLRNEKKKEYITFVDHSSTMVSSLEKLTQGRLGEDIPSSADFITTMTVLGPEKIRKALRTFTALIGPCLLSLDHLDTEEGRAAAAEAHQRVVKAHDHLIALIRKDLGVKD